MTRRRIAALAIALALPLAACSDDPSHDGPVDAGTVKGSVEHLDGRTYHCFRYTTIHRGGLWCQDVTPNPGGNP